MAAGAWAGDDHRGRHQREGPGVISSEPSVAAGGRVRRRSCRTGRSRGPSSRRSRAARVDDLRQVQCVRDACRGIVYFCRWCDRGQIYCSPDAVTSGARRPGARPSSATGVSFDGRWATARRVGRLRARRRQIVTDTGRREVGLAATVSERSAEISTEETGAVREETTDEQSIDGDLARPAGHAGDRDGRGRATRS